MFTLHFYRLIAVILLAMVSADPTFAQEGGPKAKVYQPIAPQILDTNMRALPPMSRSWREGDPVRTVEDLKEETSEPVRGPGALRAFATNTTMPVEGVNFEG